MAVLEMLSIPSETFHLLLLIVYASRTTPTTKQIAERDQRTANLETKLAKLELAVKKAV